MSGYIYKFSQFANLFEVLPNPLNNNELEILIKQIVQSTRTGQRVYTCKPSQVIQSVENVEYSRLGMNREISRVKKFV